MWIAFWIFLVLFILLCAYFALGLALLYTGGPFIPDKYVVDEWSEEEFNKTHNVHFL